MKQKKFLVRSVCLMLCLITLIGCFAACGKEDPTPDPSDSNDPTDSGSGDVGTPDDGEESKRNDVADVPEGLDFGGKTFTIRSIVQGVATKEFDAPLSGGVIDKAVYSRNQALKNKYNCYILNNETVGDTNLSTMYDEVQAMVTAGQSNNQILVTAGYKMCSLAMKGWLADIKTMDAIDLTKDYYSQGHNEALSIGNSQYLVTGKLSMSYYRYMMVMFYNPKLFDQFNVEDPMGLVLSGDWTLENAAQIAKNIHDDTGNEETNVYGFVSTVGEDSSQTDGFMSGADMRVVGKDENNQYKLIINTSTWSEAVDNIKGLLYSEGSYSKKYFGNVNTIKAFTEDRAGMISYRLYNVESAEIVAMSTTEYGYGILPMPKRSDAQEDYVSYVQDQCFLFGFPVTLTEEDKQTVGQFFEVYASDGYRVVQDTYYEVALNSRYLPSNQAKEVMRIVDSKVYVDPVNVYLSTAFSMAADSLRPVYAEDKGLGTLIGEMIDSQKLQREIDDLNQAFQDVANGTVAVPQT